MHDEGTLDGESRQGLGHQGGDLRTERTDHHERGLGRIGQGPENVEHGPHPERLPDRHQGLHRRVVVRSEQEREAGLPKALAGPRFVERQSETQRLEHVRASAPARYGAVAVLYDRESTGGGEKRGTGRQVQAPGSVTARAHDIDGSDSLGQGRSAGQSPHGAGKPPDLIRGLPLETQTGEERAGHCAGQPVLGQRREQRRGLVLGQVASIEEPLEDVLHASPPTASKSRKLRRRRSPSGVRMLSGWNWTPSALSTRCRSPMISPSEV